MTMINAYTVGWSVYDSWYKMHTEKKINTNGVEANRSIFSLHFGGLLEGGAGVNVLVRIQNLTCDSRRRFADEHNSSFGSDACRLWISYIFIYFWRGFNDHTFGTIRSNTCNILEVISS